MRHYLASMVLSLILVLPGNVMANDASPNREKVQELIEAKQYASAAELLNDEDIASRPEDLLMFTKLLVENYLTTLNYELFGLKDLEEGETITALRGQPGSYAMFGGSLEETLNTAIERNPDSPAVNYAVGFYLAKGQDCGCGQRRIFTGQAGAPGQYFLKAEEGGLYDAYSLFNTAIHLQSKNPPELDEAITYYMRSLELDPTRVPAHFNLAGIHLWKGNLDKAEKHSRLALDGYDKPELNADTHTLLGRILYAQDEHDAAGIQFRKALEIQNWNAKAFTYLIDFLRFMDTDDEYVSTVLDYIAIDYSNSYMFNIYTEYLAETGSIDADTRIEASLLEKDFNDQQTGAVYFNLGRLAEFRSDAAEALSRYRTSRDAFGRVENPPQGALPALEQRISELEDELGK